MKKLLLVSAAAVVACSLNAQEYFATKPGIMIKQKRSFNSLGKAKLGEDKTDSLLMSNGWSTYKMKIAEGGAKLTAEPLLSNKKIDSRSKDCYVDLNNDGITDIVYAGKATKKNSGVCAYSLGKPDGKFSVPIVLGAGIKGSSVHLAVGDLDGDKIKDIVISLAPKGLIMFTGSSQYKAKVIAPDAQPGILAIADFDNDGKNELFFSSFKNNHRIYKLEAGKLKEIWRDKYVNQSPTAVATADIDADGKLDLLVGGSGYWGQKKLQIYLSSKAQTGLYNNRPDSGFLPPKADMTGGTRAILLEDLNGDNKKDIVISLNTTKKSQDPGKIYVLLNQGDGKFIIDPKQSVINGGVKIVLFDVNGDNKTDLVSKCSYNPRLIKLGFVENDVNIFLRK